MLVAAGLISIALFLAFFSTGVQKIVFNPAMSKDADRLGFTKRTYRRLGVLEVLGAVALLVGLVATGSSLLALINEVAAGGLFVVTLFMVGAHLRIKDTAKHFTPALALGVVALVEMVLRLIG